MDEKPAIFILSESKNSREICKICLESENYTVYAISKDDQGLKLIRQIMPDLILIDIIKADKEGYQLLECIKADPAVKDIPVLILSAAPGIEDAVSAFQKGADDFIRKPFDVEEFIARVNAKIKHKQSNDSIKRNAEILDENQKRLNSELVKWTEEAEAFQQQYSKKIFELSISSNNLKNLSNMINATKQANNLIDRILTFSRKEKHGQASNL